MNSQYRIIEFQWKISFVMVLLIVLSAPSEAITLQGQADIEKQVNALTSQDIPALLQKAQSGDVTAQYMIGRAYYLGKGTDKNHAEALKWYRKAAEQGFAPAQYSLSNMYGTGEGVPRDTEESMNWLRKAAQQGFAEAEFFLGYFIEQSKGDYSEAVKWYRKAAAQSFAGAQNALGFLYESGQGVRQDFKESVNWYRKAAEQGNAVAQCNLGNMYYQGKGVAKDFNEAAKWYRMSAEQGYATGQASLAGIYLSGNGVPRDLVSAHMWCSLAAEAGNGECKGALKDIESYMKAEEIAEAKRRALAWSQAHPDTVKTIDMTADARLQANPVTAESGAAPKTEATRKDSSLDKSRARIVELATALENDPLSRDAKAYRKELKKMMDARVSLIVCMPALGRDLFSKQEYAGELLSQFMYSQMKFGIQNPDKVKNIGSMTMAGIEGVLRAYTAIKKAKPNLRFNDLEYLLQKQQSGLLEEFMRSVGCAQ